MGTSSIESETRQLSTDDLNVGSTSSSVNDRKKNKIHQPSTVVDHSGGNNDCNEKIVRQSSAVVDHSDGSNSSSVNTINGNNELHQVCMILMSFSVP